MSYKEIAEVIERLIKYDVKAKALYSDLLYKSNNNLLKDEKTLHPFITYIVSKVKEVYGEVDPKDLKKALIYFYSKDHIGIDVDLW